MNFCFVNISYLYLMPKNLKLLNFDIICSLVNVTVGANGKEFCAAFSNHMYSNSCQIVQFDFKIASANLKF